MRPISEDADPQDAFIWITSKTSAAALQVLLILLAADLHMKRDFWVDPIPVQSPFIVRLRADVPAATLATLRAAVDAIPDAVLR